MAELGNFAPPYASAHKEPDQCIVPRGLTMPTVVTEAGWTEHHPRLLSDMKLWLGGGAGAVKLVFVIKWYKPTTGNRVRGVVELHGLDQAGNDVRIQDVVIINLSNFI